MGIVKKFMWVSLLIICVLPSVSRAALYNGTCYSYWPEWSGTFRCVTCGSSPTACYGISGCTGSNTDQVSTGATVDDMIVCINSTYFCHIPEKIERPSITVPNGYCILDWRDGDCLSPDNYTMEAGAFCKCNTWKTCTNPDFCEQGYVLIGGECIRCSEIGLGPERGNTNTWWQEYYIPVDRFEDWCYAQGGVDYRDGTGTFRYPTASPWDQVCFYDNRWDYTY